MCKTQLKQRNQLGRRGISQSFKDHRPAGGLGLVGSVGPVRPTEPPPPPPSSDVIKRSSSTPGVCASINEESGSRGLLSQVKSFHSLQRGGGGRKGTRERSNSFQAHRPTTAHHSGLFGRQLVPAKSVSSSSLDDMEGLVEAVKGRHNFITI